MSATARAASAPGARRFVDPDLLVCGKCWKKVRLVAPRFWRVADGLPAPQVSHPDGTALCADPIEVAQ